MGKHTTPANTMPTMATVLSLLTDGDTDGVTGRRRAAAWVSVHGTIPLPRELKKLRYEIEKLRIEFEKIGAGFGVSCLGVGAQA